MKFTNNDPFKYKMYPISTMIKVINSFILKGGPFAYGNWAHVFFDKCPSLFKKVVIYSFWIALLAIADIILSLEILCNLQRIKKVCFIRTALKFLILFCNIQSQRYWKVCSFAKILGGVLLIRRKIVILVSS